MTENTEAQRAIRPTTTIEIGEISKPTVEGRSSGTESLGKPKGARHIPLPPRSASGQKLESQMPLIIAAAIASPALARPVVGLALALAIGLALSLTRVATGRGIGSADLIVAPIQAGRAALRGIGWLFNPFHLLRLIWWLTCLVAFALLIPGLLAGATWAITRGVEGILVAARLAAIAHGARVMAFALAWLIVKRTWMKSPLVSRPGNSFLRRRGEFTLTATALVSIVLVFFGGFLFEGNRWAPLSSSQPIFNSLPDVVTENLAKAQALLAQAEAETVVECINNKLQYLWTDVSISNHQNRSVALILGSTESSTASPVEIAESRSALSIALHNQMAPWIDAIVLQLAGDPVSTFIDRAHLRNDVPATTHKDLMADAAGVNVPPSTKTTTSLALACSVRFL